MFIETNFKIYVKFKLAMEKFNTTLFILFDK